MGEVERIHQIIPAPVVTPRVSEGGHRRQSAQEERESPRDRVEIASLTEEAEYGEDAAEDPVEEPYRLDIAV